MRLHKAILALGLCAAPALVLAQGLPGAKPPAPAPTTQTLPGPATVVPAASGLDLVAAAQGLRGKLSPIPGSSDGGQYFHDELGWYRFALPAEGTTRLQGESRLFQFPAAGGQSICVAVRSQLDTFKAFTPEQIQAELEVLVPSFEEGVKTGGRVIQKRAVFTLAPASLAGRQPIRVLAWDVRETNGIELAYTILPHQHGLLTFACSGPSDDVRQEIVERFLRIGAAIRR